MIKHLASLCLFCFIFTPEAYAHHKPKAQTPPSLPANEANTQPQDANKSFWISSTGKTHNKNCRYFGKGKGKLSDSPTKKNCKLCGGSVEKKSQKN